MFSLDLNPGESRGYAVVALGGELDLLDAADVATALGAVAAREPRIIVDLAGLEFIDASGVAALSRGRRDARDAGGDLLLAAPRRRVRQVLEIIWDAGSSDLHASVADAVASMAAGRPAVVPAWRPPAKIRWQRMAVNALAPKRRAVTRAVAGDWLDTGSRASCRRQPTVGEISG